MNQQHQHNEHCNHDHHPVKTNYQVKHQVQELGEVKRKLLITVDAKDVASEYEKTIENFAKNAQIKGFRKGKTPRSVIESRFAAEVKNNTMENLIKGSFQFALQESALQPISQPSIDELKLEKEKDFEYSATFEIRPEVKVENYKGLELKKTVNKVEDKQLDEQLKRLQEMQGVLKPRLAGAEAQDKDFVVIDISGEIAGKTNEKLKGENQTVQIGAKAIYHEVEEALIGKKESDTFSVKVKLAETIEDKELAGKEANLTITIRALKQKVLPELNDDFIAGLGGQAKTLLEFRQQMRTELEEAAKQNSQEKLREDALDQLAKAHPLTLPESLIQQETLHLMEKTARRMVANGMKIDKAFFEKKETQEHFKKQAKEYLQRDLILDNISQQEKITVSEEELEQHLKDSAEEMGLKYEDLAKNYEKGEAREELQFKLRVQKTLDFIIDQAKIS